MDFLNQRVVDEDSAVLGFPDEVTIGIKGTHRTMCRFESIDEQRYRCVWTNIQNLAGSASNPKQAALSGLDQASSTSGPKIPPRGISHQSSIRKMKEAWPAAADQRWKSGHLDEDFGRSSHDDVAESINQIEIKRQQKLNAAREKEERQTQKKLLRLLHNSNYEAHKDRYPPAVPGTCQWLIRHEKYQHWRQKQCSDLLWLSADAGCGKSVLLSYLIDHLRSSENKVQVPEVVCYFFFKEDNNEQNDAIHAISAILHQLYTTQPWLLGQVTGQFLEEEKSMLRSFNSLWKLLDTSTTNTSSRDVIIVMDGLDECEPSTRQQLLQSLTRFYSAREGSDLTRPPYVKTIIASRPGNDIKHAFDILPTIRLRGEDEPEAISQDVELVIKHHIENATRRGIPREVLADVRAGLIKGADRTFLWTTLVIDLLKTKKGASKRELIEILEARGDIFQIYDRLLDHSSDAAQARKMLQIVVGAIRPMKLSELSVAMAVNSEHMTFEDLELDVVHNFEERAKELCGHFIRIVRETVYLVHQTAREFLLVQTYGTNQPEAHITIPRQPQGSWHKSIVLTKAHHEVLNICLHYLSLLNVKNSRRLSIAENLFSDQFAVRFLEYAGRYWTVHYRCIAPDLSPSQLDACARLCNSQSLGFGEWFNRAYDVAQNPAHGLREGVTQRDIAKTFGLDEVVELLDRMLKPEDVQHEHTSTGIGTTSQQGVEPSAHAEDGSIAIPNSPRLLAVEQVVHPHTISPGHLLESPLSEAVDAGFHLVGANHRRLSDRGDHGMRRNTDQLG
ncbi:ankyrin repeat protein [Diaporthe helianthi]|uniref:Ankyrin repeat protein n=1 Tax=Diaporthe helianthi TaxID=158607 RepID=A0A2P5HXK6_DIAHE|nr:ankyrin repeat protein [Diaporthe helianthi]